MRRRRFPGDRHLGRAPADGADGDGDGQPVHDLDHLDHLHDEHDRRLGGRERILLVGGLVRRLVGRELGIDARVLRHERRDLRRRDRIRHRRPDRRERGRGIERGNVELGRQLVGLGFGQRQRRGRPPLASAPAPPSRPQSYLLRLVFVVVVVVVGVGTGFVTSVALYSTRVPG